MRLARLVSCAVLALAAALAGPPPALAACADEIGKLMSRDTEKLATRYNRVSTRIERQGPDPKLVAEGCRIARALEPRLLEQIAALRQSGCSKDPSVGAMVADIVRGHEADLAAMRKATAATCR